MIRSALLTVCALVVVAGSLITPPQAAAFGDVPVAVEFYKEISWLAANGISTGRLHPSSTSAFSNTRVGPAIRFAGASVPRNSTFCAGGTNVNSERCSISVQKASQSDPVAIVRVDAGGTHSIKIPLNATTTGGTGQHMSIIQPETRTAHEAWGMRRISAAEWTARYLVKTDIGVTLYGEPAANQTQVKALNNDWSKLRPLLRIVTNNTRDNVAGAG